MLEKIKRFLSWFNSPAGGLIGLGLFPYLTKLLGLLWRGVSDIETVKSVWIDAGGTMPLLVTTVSSVWFPPAMILAGLLYGFVRMNSTLTRPFGLIIDRVGWMVVAASAVVVVSSLLFDEFLLNSNASEFAKFVLDQRVERSLSKTDTAKISDIFGKESPFDNIRVAAIENPEAISYGRDFIIALRSPRQKVNGKNEDDKAEFGVPEIARLYSTKLHGLLIGVRPGAPIPVEAQRFSALIGQAGFPIGYMGWDGMPENQFVLVVGPK